MKKHRSLKRRISTRLPKKKIYVFSEGKNTEPLYFKAYERFVSSAVVDVKCQKERGVPKSLLENAKAKLEEISTRTYRRENGDDDKVWIVFDQDDHDDVPHVLSESNRLGIGAAYSNPCFEVWLILHVQDYDRDEHRNDTQSHCQKVCAGYKKDSGKVPNFNEILKDVEDAERRAMAMKERRNQDGSIAPQTNVFEITKEIRG